MMFIAEKKQLAGTLLTVGLIGAVVGPAASPAFAADLPTKKPAPLIEPAPVLPSAWTVDLTLYGWALNMTGNSGVGPLPSSPFFVSFDDILRHLDFVVMASAIARNDTFIGGVDFIWAKLGSSLTYRYSTSELYGTQADIKLTAAIATAFGGVRIPLWCAQSAALRHARGPVFQRRGGDYPQNPGVRLPARDLGQ